MLNRRNALLLALLLCLLGLEFLLRAPLGPSSSGSDLFPDLESGEVGGIYIESGEQGVHLDLKSGLWVVRERADFYAEEYLVESLLQRLPDLNTRDKVAGEASSKELYGLGQGAIHVQLSSKSGTPMIGFRVGRPAGETRGSYVQPDGEHGIYRAAALGLPQLNPTQWLNLHVIAGFDMTEVTRIEFGFGDGRKLNLELLDNGRWLAATSANSIAPTQVQLLMSYAVNSVLRGVSDVDRASAGLEPASLSLALFLKDGVRRLEVGGELAGGRALSSPDWGSNWVVHVPNSTAESLEATAEHIYRVLNPE